MCGWTSRLLNQSTLLPHDSASGLRLNLPGRDFCPQREILAPSSISSLLSHLNNINTSIHLFSSQHSHPPSPWTTTHQPATSLPRYVHPCHLRRCSKLIHLQPTNAATPSIHHHIEAVKNAAKSASDSMRTGYVNSDYDEVVAAMKDLNSILAATGRDAALISNLGMQYLQYSSTHPLTVNSVRILRM